MRVGVLASHPIQYHAPLYRELARRCDLQVFFAHRQSPQEQGRAGYGVPFDWDLDLLSGYAHAFLENRAPRPGVDHFGGSDTPEIAERVRSGGFDAFMVAGWHLNTYWQAVAACRQAEVPVMVRGDSQLQTPRSAIKHWVKAWAYPRLLRRFDACLYVGQRNREYLLHYGVPEDRLFFAPHCVDTRFFSQRAAAADRMQTRAQWGLNSADQAVLFVGRLIESKRLLDIVEAAARLRARAIPISVVVAGEGEQRLMLAEAARRKRVPVHLLGFRNQSELPAVYAAADALILPSLHETWGLVVNESLACGTPCVVSDACGAAADMIVPGVTGEMFPAKDTSALASSIERCLRIQRRSSALYRHSDKYSPAATADGVLMAAETLGRRVRRPRGLLIR